MAIIHPPRDQVIADFVARLSSRSSCVDSQEQLHAASAPYPPCVQPVEKLNPIFISQMKPQQHHRGRFVILRVCTDPGTMPGAIMAVVEDEKKTAVPLFLFNQPAESNTSAKMILSPSKLCLIREPFFKGNKKKQAYSIRVDHASDIVWLHETDQRVPDLWRKPRTLDDSATFRLQGNTAVKQRNWPAALHLYSEAVELAKTTEEKHLAYVNRALVNPRMERFEHALADATRMSSEVSPTVKSLFRTAMAYYELGNFAKCREALCELLTLDPDEPSGKTLLERVDVRLQEETTGEYSFARMYAQASKGTHLVDCASFYGPIEVRETPDHGRGLFLTRDVSAGDLILCEKAVAYTHRDFWKEESDHCMLMTLDTPRAADDSQANLSFQLQKKLLHNPAAAQPIAHLFAGNDSHGLRTAEPGAAPAVDSFRINDIVSFNSMGCPTTSKGLMGILELYIDHAAVGDRTNTDRSFPAAGVWAKASLMNHSCLANCYRAFIGDMLIVRASQDLHAGAELTIAYRLPAPFDQYKTVRQKLAGWQFVCRCQLCAYRKEVAQQRIHKQPCLFADVLEAVDKLKTMSFLDFGNKSIVNDSLQAWGRLSDAYRAGDAADRAPSLELWCLTRLSRQFALVGDVPTTERIGMLVSSLVSVGFVVSQQGGGFKIQKWGIIMDGLPGVFWDLYQAYEEVNPALCPVIKEYLRTAFVLIIGEGETFKEVFPKLADA